MVIRAIYMGNRKTRGHASMSPTVDERQQRMRSLKLYFIMTVDVDPPIPASALYIVEDGVVALLKLFDKYKIKATFFVPAIVAEKFPLVMAEIVKCRHELACHGLEHNPREATLGLGEEIRIVRTATEMIQSATGVRPVGFRAPLFRFNRSCWIALQKNDYVYDSSIVCSPLYGSHKLLFPSKPFRLSVPKSSGIHSLLEIPVSTNPFLPFPLGGAYLRFFGSWWSKVGVKVNFLSRNPVVFHIHPKDVDPWKRGRSWWGSWWGYRNIGNCMKMLEDIIEYAEQSGAKFVTAHELARLSEAGFLNSDVGYDDQPNI